MRVLVTGGAGFIGSFVVDPLVAAGHTVRITLTGREDLQPRITGQFRRGDVRHYTADIRRARETLRCRYVIRARDRPRTRCPALPPGPPS